jgi:basic membrane protein A
MVFSFGSEREQRSEKIGLVLPYGTEDPGWSGSHYQGIKTACDAFGLELRVRENVSTEGCAEAVQSLIDEGAGMIFLCGNTYPAAAEELILQNPKTAFASQAIGVDAPNFAACFARMHQGRYLAGALAALKTKSGVIGYVAAMPRTPIIREINAFTLGARRIKPDVRVVVAWSGVWADPKKEAETTRRLVQSTGADVVTYHQDDHAVPDTCEELGVDYIGFNSWFENRSKHYLGTVVCRWDIYYRIIIQHYLKGELPAIKNRWIGVDSGAIWLADVPEDLGRETSRALAEMRRRIEGRRHPIFQGPIRDRNGVLRVGEGEVLRDDTLIYRMDWFVEGVEFLGE